MGCKIESCKNKEHCKTGYCRTHHKINKNKNRDVKCCICGNYEIYGKIDGEYYCSKHAYHIKTSGKIPDRVHTDKNEYIIIDDIIVVDIYNKKMEASGVFKTDLSNLELVERYKWSSLPNGYIITKLPDGKMLYFHKELFSGTKMVVDHIDRDKRNNCISNLRPSTTQENTLNRKIKTTNTSGVTGVSFFKDMWRSRIMINRKETFVYRGLCFDDAVKMRIKYEAVEYSKYSPNYNPQTQTLQLTYHSHDDSKQTYIESDLQGNIIKFEKLE